MANVNPIILSGGGSISSGDYTVRFFDYDGTLLSLQRVPLNGSAQPPPEPTHANLVFNSWVNEFDDVTRNIDVGALYSTENDHTYIRVRVGTIPTFAITIHVNKSNTALMTIYWGNGATSTTTSSGDVIINYTYPTAGEYTIRIETASDFIIGHGTTTTTFFGNASAATSIKTVLYMFLGSRVSAIASYALQSHTTMYKIMIGHHITTIGYGVFRLNGALKCLIIPANVVTLNEAFYSCPSLHTIVLNPTSTLAGTLFYGCTALTNLILYSLPNPLYGMEFYMTSSIFRLDIDPSYNWGTAIGSNAFNYARGFLELDIPSTITTCSSSSIFANMTNCINFIFRSVTPPTLASNAFSGINVNAKIFVPDASVDNYKAATNWITYASRIFPLSQKEDLY